VGAGPADAHTGRSIRGDAVRGIRRTAAGVLPPVPIPSARDGGGAGGSNRHGRGFGIKRTPSHPPRPPDGEGRLALLLNKTNFCSLLTH